MFRIGIGYDSHRLVRGRRLVLGGVEVPDSRGLLGHSDGDVLLHAISDALLGAAGAPDIGELFPDDDPRFRDADSLGLLRRVYLRLKKKKYRVVNVDSVLIAARPRISVYKRQICRSIARVLSLDVGLVNVKGKRPEGLGKSGQMTIAAYAVAMIEGRG